MQAYSRRRLAVAVGLLAPSPSPPRWRVPRTDRPLTSRIFFLKVIYISADGSSTVIPYTTAAAELFSTGGAEER